MKIVIFVSLVLAGSLTATGRSLTSSQCGQKISIAKKLALRMVELSDAPQSSRGRLKIFMDRNRNELFQQIQASHYPQSNKVCADDIQTEASIALQIIFEKIAAHPEGRSITSQDFSDEIMNLISTKPENLADINIAGPKTASARVSEVLVPSDLVQLPGNDHYTSALLKGEIPASQIFAEYDRYAPVREKIHADFREVLKNLKFDPKTGMVKFDIETKHHNMSQSGPRTGGGIGIMTTVSKYEQTSDGLVSALNKAYGPATGLQVGGVDKYHRAIFNFDTTIPDISPQLMDMKKSWGVLVYLVADQAAEGKVEILKAQQFKALSEARNAARMSYIQGQNEFTQVLRVYAQNKRDLISEESFDVRPVFKPISNQHDLEKIVSQAGASREARIASLQSMLSNLQNLQKQAARTPQAQDQYQVAIKLVQNYLSRY